LKSFYPPSTPVSPFRCGPLLSRYIPLREGPPKTNPSGVGYPLWRQPFTAVPRRCTGFSHPYVFEIEPRCPFLFYPPLLSVLHRFLDSLVDFWLIQAEFPRGPQCSQESVPDTSETHFWLLDSVRTTPSFDELVIVFFGSNFSDYPP